jgi:hypothetical protein
MLDVRNYCHLNTNCWFKSTPDQLPSLIILNVEFFLDHVTLLTNVSLLTKRNSVYDAVADDQNVEDRCMLKWILKKEWLRKWAGFIWLEESVVADYMQMVMKLRLRKTRGITVVSKLFKKEYAWSHRLSMQCTTTWQETISMQNTMRALIRASTSCHFCSTWYRLEYQMIFSARFALRPSPQPPVLLHVAEAYEWSPYSLRILFWW